MAADELFHDAGTDIAHIKLSGFGTDLGVKHHLQQHIPQLFLQQGHVLVVDGLHGLVDFFDEIPADAFMALGGIPGAAPGGPKKGHQLYQIVKGKSVTVKI